VETIKQYEVQSKKILKKLTLEEKASLLSGASFWETKGIKRLNLDKVVLTDGPHGLRKQAGESDHLGINQSVPATCFPTAAASACSFDEKLLYQMGQAMGEECLQENVGIILGPGVNIKRSPLCGRNFEYFSEDPYLAGSLGAALIEGVQSKGVGTSLKHFAGNNQETKRMTVDAIIDERALREIYLSAFEIAVKKAQPWTLMCSYNQVNNEFASQNKYLLTDILRDEWGFEGAVMTDWGAIFNRDEALMAGLDLEMPYQGPDNDALIVEAVKNGKIPESVLDTSVLRMLCILLAAQASKKKDYHYDPQAHHQLAAKLAAASIVLLKNEDNILPLQKKQKVAVIGEFAKKPRYQGAGSSLINPLHLDNLCDVLTSKEISYSYAPGYSLKNDDVDANLIQQAQAEAQVADVVILNIGLPARYESEGFDRQHMDLPKNHIELLKAVAKVNPNIVVLLSTGSVVTMPWLSDVKGLLMLYLGGEAGAQAAVDVLFGEVNPSGRLAETFPIRLEDNPSYNYFPGGDKTVEYRESIFVGYRYYDTAAVKVLFPFGYGLSYTTFDYSDLKVKIVDDQVIGKLTVTNSGLVAGAEVIQVYVKAQDNSVLRASHELKAFKKVFLKPAESKEITFVLDERAFAYYEPAKAAWLIPTGDYVIEIGKSSRDICLTQTIHIQKDNVDLSLKMPEVYHLTKPNLVISQEDFAKIVQQPLKPMNRKPHESYNLNSTMAEIAKTKTGQQLITQLQAKFKAMNAGSDDEENMFEKMLMDIPIRSLSMFTQGAINRQQIMHLLTAMNEETAK